MAEGDRRGRYQRSIKAWHHRRPSLAHTASDPIVIRARRRRAARPPASRRGTRSCQTGISVLHRSNRTASCFSKSRRADVKAGQEAEFGAGVAEAAHAVPSAPRAARPCRCSAGCEPSRSAGCWPDLGSPWRIAPRVSTAAPAGRNGASSWRSAVAGPPEVEPVREVVKGCCCSRAGPGWRKRRVKKKARRTGGHACAGGFLLGSILLAAEKHGLVHRNLKPSNIMLVPNNTGNAHKPGVKVIDFGLAKAIADAGEGNSTANSDRLCRYAGALPSPERSQADGRALDTRSDIYLVRGNAIRMRWLGRVHLPATACRLNAWSGGKFPG